MVGIDPTRVARRRSSSAAGLRARGLRARRRLQRPPDGRHPVVFKAFALIIIGGLGSLAGAVAAAFGLGLIESCVGGLVEMTCRTRSFVMMMLVLFLRPQGLFGRGVRL